MNLPIIRPDLQYDEVADDLRAIIDSGTLTGGDYLARFERAVADAVGASHAIATTSATTALHLALVASGIGPGHEVLVSDFTFPASGNAIVLAGARPVMVDCAEGSFALDVDHAASLFGSRTAAIMPIDPFGQPANLPAVHALAERHSLVVVEDAACALGTSIAGRRCGSWPGPTCFSFHPRKVVTTGEGGAVTTSDASLASRLRALRSHAAEPAAVGMTFGEHGFNYRLSEINAALGLAQLARLDAILTDRRATATRYDKLLDRLPGVLVPRPGGDEEWSYQSYVVMLDDQVDRDRVVRIMAEEGIQTTLGTYALHAQGAFAGYGYTAGSLPRSWQAQQQSLTLPLLPRMVESDVDRVAEALARAIGRARRD